jgi:protein phosphatase
MGLKKLEPLYFFDQKFDYAHPVEDDSWNISVFTTARPESDGTNQDSLGLMKISNKEMLVAIADGMGGHRDGEKASKLALQTLFKTVKDSSRDLPGGIIKGYQKAHEEIKKQLQGAGTTLIAAWVKGDRCFLFNCGDSVAAVFGNLGGIKSHAIPHSPIQQVEEAGVPREKLDGIGLDDHVLLHALGLGSLRVDLYEHTDWIKTDLLLLASDGLSSNLSLERTGELTSSGSLDEKMDVLLEKTRTKMSHPESGHPDDLSILLLQSSAQ